jgi:hypothetical protein
MIRKLISILFLFSNINNALAIDYNVHFCGKQNCRTKILGIGNLQCCCSTKCERINACLNRCQECQTDLYKNTSPYKLSAPLAGLRLNAPVISSIFFVPGNILSQIGSSFKSPEQIGNLHFYDWPLYILNEVFRI